MLQKLCVLVGLAALALCTQALVQFEMDLPYDHFNKSSQLGTFKLPFTASQAKRTDYAFVFINDEHFALDNSSPESQSELFKTYGADTDKFTFYWVPLRMYSLSTPVAGPARETFTTANMIADLYHVLSYSAYLKDTRRIILVGSGHGATIAALYRQQFQRSHFAVIGAVADTPRLERVKSSAFYDREEPEAHPACADRISTASKHLATILSSADAAGITRVTKGLNLCAEPDVSSAEAVGFFWHSVMHPYVRAMSAPGTTELQPFAGEPALCAAFSPDASALDEFMAAHMRLREDPARCLNVKLGAWSTDAGAKTERLELLRACVDTASFGTSSGDDSIYVPKSPALRVEYFNAPCQLYVGSHFTAAHAFELAAANTQQYHGKQDFRGTNVFFVRAIKDYLAGFAPSQERSPVPERSVVKDYSGYRGHTLRVARDNDPEDARIVRSAMIDFVRNLIEICPGYDVC